MDLPLSFSVFEPLPALFNSIVPAVILILSESGISKGISNKLKMFVIFGVVFEAANILAD